MSFTGKHFNWLPKYRATDNWNLKADWCRAGSIGKVITVVQENLKCSCQLSLKNLLMAFFVVYASPNGRFASGASLILTHGAFDVKNHQNKKNKGDHCQSPLWSTLIPHCLRKRLTVSPLPLTLQPQKASDKWQLVWKPAAACLTWEKFSSGWRRENP